MKEPAVAMRKDASAVRTGPARMTARRPNRSMMKPVGMDESARPARCMTITSEATPNPTSKDFAYTGMAGSAMPVPSARINAGI